MEDQKTLTKWMETGGRAHPFCRAQSQCRRRWAAAGAAAYRRFALWAGRCRGPSRNIWRCSRKAARSPVLAIPQDVTVTRQILAEPSAGLSQHTWAALTDGTPLVTASAKGKGWLVLVHTTSGPDWSNLALSGLYADMLRRMSELGAGVADD